ncbi:MAG TPA: hypothetical protein VFU50_06630 [Terriglobales bacterium]|nr:hypothetical protein [Terriglobales bacterium]
MSIRLILAFACLLLVIGCEEHDLEQKFFKQPAATRLERMRQYPLADQYKIFRYGNDKREPPAMSLADPIAERGAAAIPFLLDQLNSHPDDITLRDILLIFETMATSKSYDVAADASLMKTLTSRVVSMKDTQWQDNCRNMLQRIKDSK